MSSLHFSEDAELFSSLVEQVGLDGLMMIIAVVRRIADLPLNLLPSSTRTTTITELVNSYTHLNVPEHKVLILLNQLHLRSDFISRLTRASDTFDSFISNLILDFYTSTNGYGAPW
ncbi:unnamed protein product [Rotaria sordida]|uniref:Uncharacterized protein n=1 Tax=Rotaria sordida TaxID=392033 RepID=A0A816DR02_9BILA|nr:unnamed protein product [Rotaria sordida]CAF1639839.1 unnamed protein product [Rotaria sordida]